MWTINQGSATYSAVFNSADLGSSAMYGAHLDAFPATASSARRSVSFSVSLNSSASGSEQFSSRDVGTKTSSCQPRQTHVPREEAGCSIVGTSNGSIESDERLMRGQ